MFPSRGLSTLVEMFVFISVHTVGDSPATPCSTSINVLVNGLSECVVTGGNINEDIPDGTEVTVVAAKVDTALGASGSALGFGAAADVVFDGGTFVGIAVTTGNALITPVATGRAVFGIDRAAGVVLKGDTDVRAVVTTDNALDVPVTTGSASGMDGVVEAEVTTGTASVLSDVEASMLGVTTSDADVKSAAVNAKDFVITGSGGLITVPALVTAVTTDSDKSGWGSVCSPVVTTTCVAVSNIMVFSESLVSGVSLSASRLYVSSGLCWDFSTNLLTSQVVECRSRISLGVLSMSSCLTSFVTLLGLMVR